MEMRRSAAGLERPYRAPTAVLYAGALVSVALILLMVLPQSPGQLGNLEFLILITWFAAGVAGYSWRQRRQPLDKDIYALSPEELAGVPTTPGSLEDSLKALEADHDFLLQGDVFTEDLLEAYIGYKRENEIDPVRLRPLSGSSAARRERGPAASIPIRPGW